MAALEYPSTLPSPQTSTVTAAERRALGTAERPRTARALQRDRLEYERLTWPPLTESQASALFAWWKETLIYGGAWFSAAWPLPRGIVTAVRKFREQPRWQFVPRGLWRISALCEVRGAGEVPQEPEGGGGGPFGDVVSLRSTTETMEFIDDYEDEYGAFLFGVGGTFDPTQAGTNVALSNGDLTATLSGLGGVIGTSVFQGDEDYRGFELVIDSTESGFLQLGIWATQAPAFDPEAAHGGVSHGSWINMDGTFDGFVGSGDFGIALAIGDVIAVFFNPATGGPDFWRNGSLLVPVSGALGLGDNDPLNVMISRSA